MFVFQFAFRREVNREMTRPQFEANLRVLFLEYAQDDTDHTKRWGIEAGFLVQKHDVHGCTHAAMAGC